VSTRGAVALVALSRLAGVAHAEGTDAPHTSPDPGAAEVGEQLRFGITSGGQALTSVTSGTLWFANAVSLTLRVPLVAASVEQPAGSYLDTMATGNPELRAVMRVLRQPVGATTLQLDAGLALGAPFASHDPSSLLPDRALAIANAIEGNGAPALLTSGVVPVTPLAGLALAWRRVNAKAAVELPVLVSRNDLSARAVIHLDATVAVSQRWSASASAQAVLSRSSTLLLRLGPALQLSRFGHLVLQLQAPVAGRLAGSTLGIGLAWHTL
jgi:hypothetical protein